jgi:glycosyltransferase involved in cell wall biosynthesis
MARNDQGPIRILHIIGDMRLGGGVQAWFMRVLRRIDRQRFHMDVQTMFSDVYDDEIRALGSRIILCPPRRRPWSYARNLKRILGENGPYDIVHSHAPEYSGYVLRLAQRAGVPIRIAHSRIAAPPFLSKSGLLRRGYQTLMARWIARYATAGLASSRRAATTMFGPAWGADPRYWQILYPAINLTPFRAAVDPAAVRAELDIPPDAVVIGHVGRFSEQKNQPFIVDIAAEVAKREPRVHLLLVGDGPLRPAIEQKVAQVGLADRVVLAGFRPDVPRLMLGAMDVFLFPSLFEGLGLVLIEAQAAGLPCVFSDVVPEEASLVKPLVRCLSLLQPPSVWAEEILAARSAEPGITQPEALALVEQSPFNIRTAVKKLEKFYLDCYQRAFERT